MASAGDIRAGGAFVELYVQDKMTAGLDALGKTLFAFGGEIATRLTGSLGEAGKAMMALGTGNYLQAGISAANVAIDSLVSSVTSFMNVGSALNDMNARTGVAVESLQELGYAAQQSGSNMGEVEVAIKTMGRQLGDALQGKGNLAEVFDALGISAQKFATLSPGQQFEELGLAIAKVEDPAKRAELAIGAFGRSGTQTLAIFAAGRDGLAATKERLKELGGTLTGDQVAQADALGDAWDDVGKAVENLKNTIGSALAPVLIDVFKWLGEVIGKFSNFGDTLSDMWRGVKLFVLDLQAAILDLIAPLQLVGDLLNALGADELAAMGNLEVVRGKADALREEIRLRRELKAEGKAPAQVPPDIAATAPTGPKPLSDKEVKAWVEGVNKLDDVVAGFKKLFLLDMPKAMEGAFAEFNKKIPARVFAALYKEFNGRIPTERVAVSVGGFSAADVLARSQRSQGEVMRDINKGIWELVSNTKDLDKIGALA